MQCRRADKRLKLSQTVKKLLSVGALKLANLAVAHAEELEAMLREAACSLLQMCLFVRGEKIDLSTLEKVRGGSVWVAGVV